MDKTTFSKHFGSYIKQLRNQKSWSQSELADILGNNFQNISAMERGEFTPTIYTVQKLADAFEITLTEMIIGFDKSITALRKS
jgi:transcriptional regulator with XRE-family HTH domain